MVSKNFMDKRGGREYHNFPSKFLSHSAKNFRRGTLQCFLNFRYRNFYAYEGIFTIFHKNLLSHSTEELRRVTLLCFTKFLVSKKNMDKSGG